METASECARKRIKRHTDRLRSSQSPSLIVRATYCGLTPDDAQVLCPALLIEGSGPGVIAMDDGLVVVAHLPSPISSCADWRSELLCSRTLSRSKCTNFVRAGERTRTQSAIPADYFVEAKSSRQPIAHSTRTVLLRATMASGHTAVRSFVTSEQCRSFSLLTISTYGIKTDCNRTALSFLRAQ